VSELADFLEPLGFNWYYRYGLLVLQPSQPLSCIFNLSYPRISVLPEILLFLNHRLENIMSGPNLAETAHGEMQK
jgi:hypothetical protein